MKLLSKKNNSKRAFFLLHGYGANGQDLYDLSNFLGDQFDYYFPDAPKEFMISPWQKGRAWFDINLEARNSQIPASDYIYNYSLKQIEEVSDTFLSTHQSLINNYNEVLIGGFSQGSMISLITYLKHPGLFSYCALFSSHLFGSTQFNQFLSKQAQFTKTKSIFQSHGDQDSILPLEGALKLKDILDEKNLIDEYHSFIGGHTISPAIVTRLKEILHAKF